LYLLSWRIAPCEVLAGFDTRHDTSPSNFCHHPNSGIAPRLFEADASLREIAIHMGWSVDYASRMIGVYAAMNPETSDGILVKLHRSK
jgi:hypothetical protein